MALLGDIAGGIADIGGIGSALFGKTNTTNTTGTTTAQQILRPEDIAAIRAQQNAQQQQTQQFQNLLQTLQQASLRPQQGLNTQFAGPAQIQAFNPQFSQGLDPMSQALISQGAQALAQQAATQRGAVARQFGGSQPEVARILQSQIAAQSALQQNPLAFQAVQQQTARELGQQGLGLQAAQANNQAQLQQAAQGALFQQAANQAILQQQEAQTAQRNEAANLGSAGLNAGQSLLSTLTVLANLFGQQQTTQNQETKQKSGGLLSFLGL